jgi:hypothetical protein
MLVATAASANAADLVAPQSTSYTYLNLEGGYVNLHGQNVQAFVLGPNGDELSDRSIDISDGYYGRGELGHVWDGGIVNGIGAYVQGWDGDDRNISETDFSAILAYQHNGNLRYNQLGCSSDGQPCSRGKAELDRSLIEGGLRFFHDYGDTTSLDGLALGIEPFVAFVDEDTKSKIGFSNEGFSPNSSRSSDLDATA